jgi:hypothetical protein
MAKTLKHVLLKQSCFYKNLIQGLFVQLHIYLINQTTVKPPVGYN